MFITRMPANKSTLTKLGYINNNDNNDDYNDDDDDDGDKEGARGAMSEGVLD